MSPITFRRRKRHSRMVELPVEHRPFVLVGIATSWNGGMVEKTWGCECYGRN
ncbi:MAG: hypothetical protein ACTSRS_19440 [Candidatus Helarchaeota archaeon]